MQTKTTKSTLITTLTHLFLAAALAASAAHAAGETTANISEESIESSRMSHRVNIAAGLLTDQLTILGVTVGYQVADYMRIRGAVGTNGFGPTIAVGSKFMVPGWNVTPTVGFDLAYVVGNFDLGPLGSQSFSGIIPTTSIGVEWTASGGFYLEGGLVIVPQALSAGAAPFLGLGASL